MSRLRIERIEPATGGEEDPLVASISPVHDAAIDVRLARPLGERIESPQQRAAVGTERDDGERRGSRVENPVDDDRGRLDLGMASGRDVAGVVRPRDTQPADVAAVDLIEQRVARVSGLASRDAPVVRWSVVPSAPRRGEYKGGERLEAQRLTPPRDSVSSHRTHPPNPFVTGFPEVRNEDHASLRHRLFDYAAPRELPE